MVDSLPRSLGNLQIGPQHTAHASSSASTDTPAEQKLPLDMSPMAPNTHTTRVNINLPPVRKFSGEDGDPHGITDFIARIEKNIEHEYGEDETGKESSMVSTFREYLSGDAKDYWGMISKEDKRNWEKIKTIYIKKFKTEREQRLIARARSQMASLRQKREESLKQYGERALRLRQRLEETDEPFLVQRFRKGLRSKAERRLLASRVTGEEKVTMQQLNQQILSICEDDDDSSVESLVDSEASDSGHGSASDDEDDAGRRRRNKGRAKRRTSKKEKSGDADLRRQLEEYAERLKKVEEERESFRVEAYNVQRQAGDGNQQGGFQGNYRGNQQGNLQGGAQGNYSGGRQGGYQGRQGSGGYRQRIQNTFD